MSTVFRVKRAYVNECERCWSQIATISKHHTNKPCFNIKFDGAAATEFKQIEFKVEDKNGTATYILVATNVDQNSNVTVCYSYHHINERILENKVFTMQAADITIDWLRAKSCESLKAMLPSHAAPKLIYE